MLQTVRTRLNGLELRRLRDSTLNAIENIEERFCEIGQHPDKAFYLYRSQAFGWSELTPQPGLVIKGHCNRCGYDGYLWELIQAMEDQLDRMAELGNEQTPEGRECIADLMREGLVTFTPWTNDPEQQEAYRLQGVRHESTKPN